MLSQQIQAPGSPSALNATQYYRYDALNRLGIVAEGVQASGPDTCPTTAGTWCRDFSYDRYGNRAVTGSFNGGLSLATPTATSAYTASTNRLTGTWANYDGAGNVTAFVKSGYEWSAFYDAENKQRFYCGGTTAACSSANDTAEYVYDGEGNRVQKLTSGVTETFVYDAFGRLAAEYSTAGPSGTAGSYFRTTDHLGSTRLVTDGSGDIHDRRDFFPFGEKILASSTYSNRHYVAGYNNANPASAHLFTAKERDAESGLDYFGARYMSSALGRFTSADVPLADQWEEHPQGWNLYGYVRNNPLRFIDPTGRECVTFDDGSQGDDGIGSACSGAQLGTTDDVTVTGAPGNPLSAFFINFAFALNNMANDSFAGLFNRRPKVLENIPPSEEFVGQLAAGSVFVASMFIGPSGGAQASLRLIHGEATLSKSILDGLRKKTTQEIIETLKPGLDDALKVKPDGRVMDGNHRVKVLMERGVNVDSLPREIVE